MRFTRLLIGLAVLAISVWIIIGEQLAGVSADAVVNARLVSVRAPIAGDVTLEPIALGSRVSRGDALGAVADPRVDAIRRDDLLMEHAFETAAIARDTAIIADLEAISAVLTARSTAWRSERLAELDARLTQAQAGLKLLGDEAGAETEGSADTLSAASADDPGAADATSTALQEARARLQTLQIARTAAERGLFLGDGYNDAPWSEQYAAEIGTRLAQLRASVTMGEARLTAVIARLDAERLAVNRLAQAQLRSPIDGLVWELLSASGENVQRGDELMNLLDCGSVMVTLSVTENVYNSLSVGDPARFRPAGSDQVFEGSVVRLAGSGAETIYRNLAVAPSQRHLERYDVAVSVPELASHPDLACAIGRTGRVFFDDRPLDWLRG